MTRRDPLPARAALARFRRMMRRMAWLSLACAAVAVGLVAYGDDALHIHMLIATALGVGLTVLLGTALMSLAFLSASSGHDDEAAASQRKDTE